MAKRSSQSRDKLAANIGARARAARLHVTLTQADVAEQIEIDPEVYGRLERGRMLPSVETLTKLARALKLSADELLGLKDATEEPAHPPPILEGPPEFRRLLRHVRKLDVSKLRLLATIAGAMSRKAGSRP